MTKKIRTALALLLAVCTALLLCGCSGSGEKKGGAADLSAVAGDYYLDLTELGMKLTVYLRLDASGEFTFSNTLSFDTVKSAGTCQPTEDGYLMVFTSVNGEEKSISDGLTSGFAVLEDGSLDFGGNNTVPYGSANISTVSEDDPSVRLTGVPVTDDYIAPSTESAFQTGTYTAESTDDAGAACSHAVSFFEDNTYLHVMRYVQDDRTMLAFETGTYGVSTSQLALEPEGGEGRVQCEIVDGSRLKLSVLPGPGATERAEMDFALKDAPERIASLGGSGAITGSVVTFDVTVELYEDGSYIAVADGHEEKGLIAIDSAAEYAKQYPDHPSTGVRGMSQVTAVPYAVCGYDSAGKLMLTDLRVCTSDNLTRFKATVTEQ